MCVALSQNYLHSGRHPLYSVSLRKRGRPVMVKPLHVQSYCSCGDAREERLNTGTVVSR